MKNIFTFFILLTLTCTSFAQKQDTSRAWFEKLIRCKSASEVQTLIKHSKLSPAPAEKFLTEQTALNGLKPHSATMTSTSSESKKTFTYDNQGRLTEIQSDDVYPEYQMTSSSKTVISFDGQGRRSGITMLSLFGGNWIEQMKATFTYDGKGDMVQQVGTSLTDSGWVMSDRTSITYDDRHNPLTVTEEEFDYNTQKFGYKTRHSYTYDSNNRQLSYLDEFYIDGQWVKSNFSETTYNSNGDVLTQFSGQYQNGMIFGSKIIYEYNGQGHISSMTSQMIMGETIMNLQKVLVSYGAFQSPEELIYQMWSGEAWVNTSRQTVKYLAFEKPLVLYNYTWALDKWFMNQKDTCMYDANGNLLEKLETEFDGTAWVNDSRNVFTYDSRNNKLTETRESWKTTQWVIMERTTCTYDDKNQMRSKIYDIAGTGWELLPSYKMLYDYDIAGNRIMTARFGWKDGSWTAADGNLETELLWDIIDQEVLAYLFFYGDGNKLVIDYGFPSGVEDENGHTVASYRLGQNYPNPFNPSTTISYELPKVSAVELKVFDVLGREVATLVNSEQAAGTHTVSFNASNLSSGIYICRIKADGFTASQKMMLVK